LIAPTGALCRRGMLDRLAHHIRIEWWARRDSGSRPRISRLEGTEKSEISQMIATLWDFQLLGVYRVTQWPNWSAPIQIRHITATIRGHM